MPFLKNLSAATDRQWEAKKHVDVGKSKVVNQPHARVRRRVSGRARVRVMGETAMSRKGVGVTKKREIEIKINIFICHPCTEAIPTLELLRSHKEKKRESISVLGDY